MNQSRIESLQAASATFTAAGGALKRELEAAHAEGEAALSAATDEGATDAIRAARHQIDSALNELGGLNIDTFVDAATGA